MTCLCYIAVYEMTILAYSFWSGSLKVSCMSHMLLLVFLLEFVGLIIDVLAGFFACAKTDSLSFSNLIDDQVNDWFCWFMLFFSEVETCYLLFVISHVLWVDSLGSTCAWLNVSEFDDVLDFLSLEVVSGAAWLDWLCWLKLIFESVLDRSLADFWW